MNETERAALVDELAEAMWLSGRDDTEGHEWHGDVRETGLGRMILGEATACLPIIDRLLATRAAPGLDGDAVERAAKAMYRLWCSESRHKMSDEEIEEGWEKHRQWTYENNWEPTPKVFGMARAALAAAGTAPGLDADRVIRKLGSLQGQMIEIKSNINALQVETERLEDYMRNAVAQAMEGDGR